MNLLSLVLSGLTIAQQVAFWIPVLPAFGAAIVALIRDGKPYLALAFVIVGLTVGVVSCSVISP